MLKPDEPRFFINADSELLENYRQTFELFSKEQTHTLIIDVSPDVVEGMDVSMAQELVLALQHFPHLIEKFIFSIQFKFQEIKDSELYLSDDTWKEDALYQRWFHRMSTFPPIIFFLNDSESRFYFLAGDLVADGKYKYGDKKGFISFEGEQITELNKRMFTCCWLFHIYCHASGFNPKHYIESLLADIETGITYEFVFEQYTEDIEKGTLFRSKPTET